jgi:hypothetical protein
MVSHRFAPTYVVWAEEERFLNEVGVRPTENAAGGLLLNFPQERMGQLFCYR